MLSGVGVKQEPAPLKAELSPSWEGDVALPPCSRLKDGTPSVCSLATDPLCGPWDTLWAWGRV